MNLTPIDQGVAYYHVHHCACGADVFHDGATATCEQSYFETFQCARCKPCVYEELRTEGRVQHLQQHNLLETVFILAIGWICGLISYGALHWLLRWLILR